jgi:hypothetical protein
MRLSRTAYHRLFCLLALTAVIALGLTSRLVPLGWWLYDKSLGDVLYAMAAYFGLAFLFPGLRVTLIAAAALAWCLAVEFLQLTELNARLVALPLLRWVLGTTFSWHGVICYCVGVTLAVVADALLRRRPPSPDGEPA